MAYGAPMPQETPASTSAIPNFEHFANFGARVAQPVVLAPQPVGAVGGIVPLFNAPPVPAQPPMLVPSAVQKIVALHRAELTPFDLLLADPNTHTHPYGAHPGLPIHPGYDKPHSHAPYTQHPVVDMRSGAIVSEPFGPSALRLAPLTAAVAPAIPLTPALHPLSPTALGVPIAAPLGPTAQSIVNPPRVVDVDQQAGSVDVNVGAPVLLPQARQPLPLIARQPLPLAQFAPIAAPVPLPVAAPLPTAPAFAPAFNFAPAPAVVQQPT